MSRGTDTGGRLRPFRRGMAAPHLRRADGAARRSRRPAGVVLGVNLEVFRPSGPARATVVLCHGLPSGQPPDPSDEGYPGLARRLTRLGVAAATFPFSGCYAAGGDLSLAAWAEDLGRVVGQVDG